MAELLELIEKTRDGISLSLEDAEQLVTSITDGSLPDYQLSAWLMAAYCKGLSLEEVYFLTDAVARSGGQVAESLGIVDKHSTGGVGDKTTLILAPLVSSLGVPMAKMSGRGLGHTGGTLDKLESIPGYQIDLTNEAIRAQMEQIGVAVVAQTGELAPADKRMYALRDVTATVDDISLIAISIMSKKLAAGAKNIVLDVKVGNGAFMSSLESARELARLMVRIGTFHGRNVRAILTRMDQPLGFAIGNAIEVNEAIHCLQGHGPADLREEVIELACHMISMAKGISVEDAMLEVVDALDHGSAFHQFKQWIAAQGGNLTAIEQDLPLAPIVKEWVSEQEGFVRSIDTHAIGKVALDLGAGRHKIDDSVDLGVGLLCFAKVGQSVKSGDVLATVYARSEQHAAQAIFQLQQAITLGETNVGHASSAILDTIVSQDEVSL